MLSLERGGVWITNAPLYFEEQAIFESKKEYEQQVR